MGEPSYVLTVKLLDNIGVPAFSELEVLAQVKCDGSHCYVLEKFRFASGKSNRCTW